MTASSSDSRDARLSAIVARLFTSIDARALSVGATILSVLVLSALLRLHFAAFLDPFEDGYQNWWISANLVSTGEYWDRHSMMTQGNWLPAYHFLGAGVLLLGGLHSILALKTANIVISGLTTVLVFGVGRRQGWFVGTAAAGFFGFNFIDIVVSGWSTAESLASFLVFVGYAFAFRSSPTPRSLTIAATAFALAVLTRYEAWLVVMLVLGFAFVHRPGGPTRRELIWTMTPAIGLMIGYFLFASQWGFLPQIITNQTSTDLRYQLSVGTQPATWDVLGLWWANYFLYFPAVLVLGTIGAARRITKDVGPWIILALWGFVIVYAVARLGNPSYRYVLFTLPFLAVYAATTLETLVRDVAPKKFPSLRERRHTIPTLLVVGALVGVGTMIPVAASFWGPGFATSSYMVPLRRAGEFVAGLSLPDDTILVSESPIAAYYSGLPPDRILGARWLPQDRDEALGFLQREAAFIVYVGVPYYSLRLLFPELQQGQTTPQFELLFDAKGPQAGTHAVHVYRVIPA